VPSSPCRPAWRCWLLCSIIATVKAFNGEDYRYPLTIRLF
jgi:uncharacterized Tic20 family protein